MYNPTGINLKLSDDMQNELSQDQLKVIYRGNFTIKQAALYLGKSVEWVRAKIQIGMIGTNSEGSRISRVECDRFLRSETIYEV